MLFTMQLKTCIKIQILSILLSDYILTMKNQTQTIYLFFEEYINKEAFELQMKSERYKAFKDTIADMLYMSLDS